ESEPPPYALTFHSLRGSHAGSPAAPAGSSHLAQVPLHAFAPAPDLLAIGGEGRGKGTAAFPRQLEGPVHIGGHVARVGRGVDDQRLDDGGKRLLAQRVDQVPIGDGRRDLAEPGIRYDPVAWRGRGAVEEIRPRREQV